MSRSFSSGRDEPQKDAKSKAGTLGMVNACATGSFVARLVRW